MFYSNATDRHSQIYRSIQRNITKCNFEQKEAVPPTLSLTMSAYGSKSSLGTHFGNWLGTNTDIWTPFDISTNAFLHFYHFLLNVLFQSIPVSALFHSSFQLSQPNHKPLFLLFLFKVFVLFALFSLISNMWLGTAVIVPAGNSSKCLSYFEGFWLQQKLKLLMLAKINGFLKFKSQFF